MGAVQDISDVTFEAEVLKSDVPVLIDFWAPWCGPCKAIAPVVDELAKEYAGRLKVVTGFCKKASSARGPRCKDPGPRR